MKINVHAHLRDAHAAQHRKHLHGARQTAAREPDPSRPAPVLTRCGHIYKYRFIGAQPCPLIYVLFTALFVRQQELSHCVNGNDEPQRQHKIPKFFLRGTQKYLTSVRCQRAACRWFFQMRACNRAAFFRRCHGSAKTSVCPRRVKSRNGTCSGGVSARPDPPARELVRGRPGLYTSHEEAAVAFEE